MKKGQRLKNGIFNIKSRKTSMFFVLWAAFSIMALVLVFVFTLSQNYFLKDTYEREAIHALDDKGSRINDELRQPPPEAFGNNYDGFIRFLSTREGVLVCVLDGNGMVLMPLEPNEKPNDSPLQENYNFIETITVHRQQLTNSGATVDNQKGVVYSVKGGFVYGAVLPPYQGTENTYLYIYQSVEFVQVVEDALQTRTIWIAAFVFILSFAVSSVVSGMMVKPLDEISAKAKRLAKGDFEVDFQGNGMFEEMDALAASLNFAKDELSKTDRMQKELIANVSHDFKTPLTMIKAYAEMIIEVAGEDKEKRDRSAQVIIDEADRLASLVSDVLDLSKIRSGIQALALERFDVSAYLNAILTRFEYLSEAHGYTVETEIEEGLCTVADKLKIGQVLYNLIGNAVNYTGDSKKVSVTLKQENGCIRFAVVDSGKGIPQEELPDIWERYYRSSEAHKRPVKGTGLGLSIVKTILEKHGFAFGVDSIMGVGSTFYVLFPIAKQE